MGEFELSSALVNDRMLEKMTEGQASEIGVWTDVTEGYPAHGSTCLVELENRDFVFAYRCLGWQTEFFTSRAIKPKRGTPQRHLEKLKSPAVRWCVVHLPPVEVSTMVMRELCEKSSQSAG